MRLNIWLRTTEVRWPEPGSVSTTTETGPRIVTRGGERYQEVEMTVLSGV